MTRTPADIREAQKAECIAAQARTFLECLPADGGTVKVLQDRVRSWTLECFGDEIACDLLERMDRFTEEALELVQSLGYTPDRAHALVDYVFGLEAGEPSQETGGTMTTLAALCNVAGIDIEAAFRAEVERITTPAMVMKIRAKQAAKPTGSALPVALSTHTAAGAGPVGVAVAWRCFHCDDVFASEHSARLHFGREEGATPACKIKGSEIGLVEALRRAEDEASDAWMAIHNETMDAARAYHAQAARHRQQLTTIEQVGYDRGLADAKAHPETLGLAARPVEEPGEPPHLHDETRPHPNARAICEALGFDPTNHHNAAKCPYCAPAEEPGEVERLTRERDDAVVRYASAVKDAAEQRALAERRRETICQYMNDDGRTGGAALAETQKRLVEAHAERSQLLADLQLLRTEMATAVTEMQDRAEAAEARIFFFEAEARRYAGDYVEGSDGRNTFVIFADMIAERAALTGDAQEGGK